MEERVAKKIALVIGNSDYHRFPRLKTPINNAKALSQALERLGFDVECRLDVNHDSLRHSLRNFGAAVEGADTAVVYFSGHGIGVNGRNYLIPVDARIDRIRDVIFEGVSLDLILFAVDGAKGFSLVMLDANFNNPFHIQLNHGRSEHSIELGFQDIKPPSNVLVTYSGEEHTFSIDKFGGLSPFAAVLISNIEKPGEGILKILREVRSNVIKETDGLQMPYLYGSLRSRDIYLGVPSAFAALESKYQSARRSQTYIGEVWNDAPSRRYRLSDWLWQGIIIGILVATYILSIWQGTISFELLAGAVIACGFLNLLRASREGN
jgi:uncharacterized caspase-like protein